MDFWLHPLYGRLPVFDSNNSMGLVRYFLALAVMISHFNLIFDCKIPFFISSYNAVGAFFALSGFLLYGSYLRNANLKRYVLNRSRRLLPPFIFIVSLCAFLLVFVSIYNWRHYFINSEWVRYFIFNLSFLNFLQPELPGVFINSNTPAVNGSLWTMKVEIMLYLSIPVIVLVSNFICKKFKRTKPLKIFLVIYLISLAYRLLFLFLYDHTGKEIYQILGRQFLGQLMYFYSGVFIYFIYDRFRKTIKYILPLSILAYFLFSRIDYAYTAVLPFVVSVIVIAFSSFKGKLSIFNYNNISYDIYLFHFPVIQIFYQYRQVFDNNIPVLFCLSLLSVLMLSLFSWFVIEKRFLPKKFI